MSYLDLTTGMAGAFFQDPSVSPQPVSTSRTAVKYLERWPDSPRIELRDDGSNVIREYLASWDEPYTWLDAARNLLGYPLMVQGTSGWYISRQLPDSFPLATADNGFAPAHPFLYCTAIRSLKGKDCPQDMVTKDVWNVSRFRTAEMEALYETLTYEVRSDTELSNRGEVDGNANPDESYLSRYVTIVPSPSAQTLVLPPGSFVRAIDAVPVTGGPPKLQPECDLVVTWHQVPLAAVGLAEINPYIATTVSGAEYTPPIDACIGKVNRTRFHGCRKGTLLLQAAIVRPIRSSIGDRLVDIEYRFKRISYRSTHKLSGPNGTDYQYGHNVLYLAEVQAPKAGYYEIVKGTAIARDGKISTTVNATTITNLSVVSDLSIGMTVSGKGIPVGSTIQAIDNLALTVTINNSVTFSGVVPLTFTQAGSIGASSNYLLSGLDANGNPLPADGVNLYDYADFSQLFQVPALRPPWGTA